MATAHKVRVGVIGLGIMGSAIASRLVRTRFHVAGYDVVAARRTAVRRAGAEAVDSPTALSAIDIVITSLPSSSALLEVASELAAGRRAQARRSSKRAIVIETSTLPVAVKEEARRTLAAAGTILLDCPLSGTGAQARTGDVVVYASGDRAACRRVTPVLEGFARAHYYVGPFGAGSKTKFVANLLVAIHNVATAEALVLARKAGLDAAMVLKVVSAGVGSSRVLQLRGPMMVSRTYDTPTMKLDVWRKDMRIIAEFARQVDCPTPLFSATVPLYAEAIASGRGGEDTAAVHAVLEQLAGLNRPASRRKRP